MSAHPAAAQQKHGGVRELLPFFVNGTLSELENARVIRHVTSCASCTAELGEQRRLSGVDPSVKWHRLRAHRGTETEEVDAA